MADKEAKQPKKKISRNTLNWIYKVSVKQKWYVVALSAVQTISGLSGVVYALFLRYIIDSAVAGDKKGFLIHAILFGAITIIQIVLNLISSHLTEISRSSLENAFKERLFHNILVRDFARICAVHSGEWMNRLTNDTSVVANAVTDILPGLMGMLTRFISAVAMIVLIDWRIVALMVPVGIVMAIVAYAFRSRLKALHKKVQEKDGLLRIFLQENIASLMLVRSFSAEEEIATEAAGHMVDHKKVRMKKNTFSNFTRIGFWFAMNGMFFLGVVYGGIGILHGTITYGTLMEITQLIRQIQMPIMNITGVFPQIFTMTASAERLMEVEQYVADEEKALSPSEVKEFYDTSLKAIGVRNLGYTYYPPSDQGGTFSKEGMPPAINDISLEVAKGQIVAFTGHSGCGKSTVLKLLMSIYPQDEGEKYITFESNDEFGEEPLTSKWHNLFAYVPQGNYLMSGTIRQIVTFGERSAIQDDERIRRALRAACAEEFVNGLEDGLDTLLGERGTGLSEGQMQRVALARAIFAARPILLLDEATSALDDATEKQVLQNVHEMEDKTVIIITHRPAALSICDKILHFGENGVTEEQASEILDKI